VIESPNFPLNERREEFGRAIAILPIPEGFRFAKNLTRGSRNVSSNLNYSPRGNKKCPSHSEDGGLGYSPEEKLP